MECSLNNYFKTLHPAASFSSWQLALASLLAKDWLLSTVTKFQLETGKKFIWNRMEILEALYNSVYLLNSPNPGVQAFEWCWHALEWCWVLYLGKKIMLQIVFIQTFRHTQGHWQHKHCLVVPKTQISSILTCTATSSPTDFVNYFCIGR